jgi:glucokinase
MAGNYVRGRAVAVDLGGTQFRVALGTSEGEIEWRTSRPTRAERGPQATLDSIFDAVQEAVAATRDRGTIKGIGIGAPGPVDPWAGVIHTPPNLPGWDGVPLKRMFEEKFDIPTQVANDANLAAVGEHRYGAGRGLADVIYVTASTGIGGGIIANNQLLLGHRGYAGEIGHMTISMNGPRCGCGNAGCLEALASGTAIARRARELVSTSEDTKLRLIAPTEITAKVVAEMANQGDQLARQIFQEAAVALGTGMANLALLFNPQRIIIGGGLSKAGPLLWDTMLETVRARAMAPCQEDLEIVPAGLADDAGLFGGLALAIFGQQEAASGN